MKTITIYYYISDNGDGSASVCWYLTREKAEKKDEAQHNYGGFAEETVNSVETFEGSDIHQKAVENEEEEDE